MGVAGLHQPLGKLALFVVVDQGEARHGFAFAVLDLVLHQAAANEIADGFRTVAEIRRPRSSSKFSSRSPSMAMVIRSRVTQPPIHGSNSVNGISMPSEFLPETLVA